MSTPADHETVKARAHELWEKRGRPIGSPDEDWLEAERQLQGKVYESSSPSKGIDESIKQSFPASDPPASQLPDEPPANAEAKWAAAGVDRDELCRTSDKKKAKVGRRMDSPR